MATEFCQKCKQAHSGSVCDYDEKGDCAETVNADEVADPSSTESKVRVEGDDSHRDTELSHN
jgi:hypothetical protein